MIRAIKKPIEVQTIQFDGWNWGECYRFMGNEPFMFTCDMLKEEYIIIKTLEGDMRCYIGDYIIKGVKGEFYPCKPDIFKATYDEIIESNEQ